MDKEKIREQIGITLLAAIIFLSGYILFSQKTEPINFIAAKDSSNAVVSDSVPAPSNKTTAEAKGLVNINLGSIEDLDTLPGIGAVTA